MPKLSHIQAIKHIGVGFAFSPTLEALIAESKALADIFGAELVFIHAGKPADELKNHFSRILQQNDLSPLETKVIYREGKVEQVLDKVALEEDLDLIITGALKREPARKNLTGSSIARNVARRLHTLVLLIPEARTPVQPIRKIVAAVNEEHPERVLEEAIYLARQLGAELHIVKESAIKAPKAAISQYYPEKEYQKAEEKLRKSEQEFIDKLLSQMDTQGVKMTIEVIFGHTGLGVVEYANEVHADLLIDIYPEFSLGILDRLFPHDVECVLMNLPCKLLLIR